MISPQAQRFIDYLKSGDRDSTSEVRTTLQQKLHEATVRLDKHCPVSVPDTPVEATKPDEGMIEYRDGWNAQKQAKIEQARAIYKTWKGQNDE